MKSKLNLLPVFAVVLTWSSIALANGVHTLFDPSAPNGGPFPSDVFTVAECWRGGVVGEMHYSRILSSTPSAASVPWSTDRGSKYPSGRFTLPDALKSKAAL